MGNSGGPLLRKDTTEVLGMMSWGLPPNVEKKSEVYAIDRAALLPHV